MFENMHIFEDSKEIKSTEKCEAKFLGIYFLIV